MHTLARVGYTETRRRRSTILQGLERNRRRLYSGRTHPKWQSNSTGCFDFCLTTIKHRGVFAARHGIAERIIPVPVEDGEGVIDRRDVELALRVAPGEPETEELGEGVADLEVDLVPGLPPGLIL